MKKHTERYVITADGNYKDKVLVISDDETGIAMVYAYKLQSGEMLIEAEPPTHVKARWTGKGWEETATPEEIAAHRDAQQALLDLGLRRTN